MTLIHLDIWLSSRPYFILDLDYFFSCYMDNICFPITYLFFIPSTSLFSASALLHVSPKFCDICCLLVTALSVHLPFNFYFQSTFYSFLSLGPSLQGLSIFHSIDCYFQNTIPKHKYNNHNLNSPINTISY